AAEKKEPVVFDYRETAPAAATKDMFVTGKKTSHRMVGVPGSVAGLWLAHKSYGKLAWKDLVAPAVKLAEDGFVVDAPLAKSINKALAHKDTSDELKRIFGKKGGWKAGDRLVQKDLGKTLRRIMEKGADGFYKGETAILLEKE